MHSSLIKTVLKSMEVVIFSEYGIIKKKKKEKSISH